MPGSFFHEKVIFLDIDGVLNDHKPVVSNYGGIFPRKVKMLNQITDATEAVIVVSSAWRYMVHGGAMTLGGFKYMFLTHGVRGNVIDITPSDEDIPTRPEQITYWLQNNNVGRYIIIDDIDFGFELTHPGRFVKTHPKVGLTKRHIEKAIGLLV